MQGFPFLTVSYTALGRQCAHETLNPPIVVHASDDVIVGLDGPLAVPCGDLPMPEKETPAGGNDLRTVRVQSKGYLPNLLKLSRPNKRQKGTSRAKLSKL